MYLCYRMVWIAGILASFSTITYPAVSAYVSMHSDGDKQGYIIISVIIKPLKNNH